MSKLPKIPAFISVVIYANECEQVIFPYLQKISKSMEDNFKTFEIIVVDDASIDNTESEIKKVSKTLKSKIRLVTMSWKHGVEYAIMAGVDAAIGDFVYEIEMIDLDHPDDLLIEIYSESAKGFDIVSAYPKNKPSKISKSFYKILNFFADKPLNIKSETMRMVSRRALNAVSKSREKIRYRKGLFSFTGLPSKNITYNSINPKLIKHHQNSFNKVKTAVNVLVAFTDFGWPVTFMFAFFFGIISAGMSFYTIFTFLTRDVIEGWTTMMLMISFGFAGVFFILALIVKYLSLILVEVQGREPYRVKRNELISNF